MFNTRVRVPENLNGIFKSCSDVCFYFVLFISVNHWI